MVAHSSPMAITAVDAIGFGSCAEQSWINSQKMSVRRMRAVQSTALSAKRCLV